MGRKAVIGVPRDNTVKVRMTSDEFKTLKLIAGSEQKSVSDMLRDLVREAAIARAIVPDEQQQQPN